MTTHCQFPGPWETPFPGAEGLCPHKGSHWSQLIASQLLIHVVNGEAVYSSKTYSHHYKHGTHQCHRSITPMGHVWILQLMCCIREMVVSGPGTFQGAGFLQLKELLYCQLQRLQVLGSVIQAGSRLTNTLSAQCWAAPDRSVGDSTTRETHTCWKSTPCAHEQFLGFGTSSQSSFFILKDEVNSGVSTTLIHAVPLLLPFAMSEKEYVTLYLSRTLWPWNSHLGYSRRSKLNGKINKWHSSWQFHELWNVQAAFAELDPNPPSIKLEWTSFGISFSFRP